MIKEESKILKFDKVIFNNSIYTIIGLLISYTVSLITSVIITRFVSKEIYGNYRFIISVFAIFSIFTIPGLRTGLFKSISQNYDGTYNKSLRFSLKFSIIGIISLIIFGLILSFNDKFENNFETGITIIICGLFISLFYSLDLWQFLLKGKERFKAFVVQNALISIIHLGLVILLLIVFDFYNVFLLIILYITVKSALNVIFSIRSQKYINNKNLDPNWKKQGLSLTILDLSALIFSSSDSVIMGIFLPLESIAIFSITLLIGNGIIIVIKSMIEVWVPRIYRHKSDLTIKNMFFIFLISFIVPFLLGFIIHLPILFLYTSKYESVILFTQIYIYIIPFHVFNTFLILYLIKHNYNKELNISKIITILLTLLLSFILIPIYGIMGAIISSFSFFVIQDISYIIIIRHKKKIDKTNEI